jgi:hypothetical protein
VLCVLIDEKVPVGCRLEFNDENVRDAVLSTDQQEVLSDIDTISSISCRGASTHCKIRDAVVLAADDGLDVGLVCGGVDGLVLERIQIIKDLRVQCQLKPGGYSKLSPKVQALWSVATHLSTL